MPTLILTDVHGNLPALEAVLDTPEARRCHRIISLGDHVNFGPESRAVHERLTSLGAIMLLGNHEERLLRPEDAEFAGYNWRLLHFTARQMQGISLDLPVDFREGSVIFTHGTPGDPYHLLYPEEVPGALEALPEGATTMISGHHHLSWDVSHQGRRAFNPGSVGVAEDGEGGMAPFAVMEDDGTLQRHMVRYDLAQVARAFVDTGAAQAAPEMCRAVYHTMCTGEHMGVTKFIRFIIALGKEQGLSLGDEVAWKMADRQWTWAQDCDSIAFWQSIK